MTEDKTQYYVKRDGKQYLRVFARSLYLVPDKRQYMQNSAKFLLSPVAEFDKSMEDVTPLIVAIDVPMTREYIANLETESQIKAELGYEPEDGDKKELVPPNRVILTVAGYNYVRDQLQGADYSNG